MILVTKSSMPSYEEYCKEIKKLWDSHWLTNMGIEHKELQRALEEYLDCPNVVLYTNGHLALENIISAMQFPKGSDLRVQGRSPPSPLLLHLGRSLHHKNMKSFIP